MVSVLIVWISWSWQYYLPQTHPQSLAQISDHQILPLHSHYWSQLHSLWFPAFGLLFSSLSVTKIRFSILDKIKISKGKKTYDLFYVIHMNNYDNIIITTLKNSHEIPVIWRHVFCPSEMSYCHGLHNIPKFLQDLTSASCFARFSSSSLFLFIFSLSCLASCRVVRNVSNITKKSSGWMEELSSPNSRTALSNCNWEGNRWSF